MRYFFQMAAVAALLSASQVHGIAFDDSNNQWYAEADFLWWKAVEDSLPTAIVIDTTTTGTGTDQSAHVLNPNHKWDPGFRIEVGYQPCGCDWDFFASWTHFNTKATRSFSPGSATETIVPQFGSLEPFAANLATLSSSWHLNLNWADFELDKTFCDGPCFKFGVHAGLRGLWINQKINFSLTEATETPVTNTFHSKSNYSSIGAVVGLDASWLFECGLSVNASAGGAILYGRQHSKSSESIAEGAALDTLDGSSNYNISRAMTDLRIGIGYEGCLCDKTFLLRADWEHHILFCQNQFPRGSTTANARPRDGDLTLQGVTFSASLFF